jgi:SAM-dependent methyltransferase
MSGNREQVMEQVMAFWQSRIILTGAELDVFTALDGAPRASAGLADALGCDVRGMEHLLNALAALGLLDKQGEVFHLSATGALFSARHPETVLPMLLHFNGLWRNWSRLSEVVRTGKPGRPETARPDEAARRAFIGAMHAIGRGLAVEIAAAFDASGHRRLLDIGGASGSYTIAFLHKNPRMEAVLFDLPPVIPMAAERLQAEGLQARARLVAGDFNTDELPAGCDLALLSAIIHQNDQAQNIALYGKVFRALAPGGTLLIRDHIMDGARTTPVGGALFAVNMLVNTPGGTSYTFEEIEKGLRTAGFRDVAWIRKGERMDGLVTAKKV